MVKTSPPVPALKAMRLLLRSESWRIAADVAVSVLMKEYSVRARNAIFCPDMAAAVVGASAVVAMSAAPPITVSRHCLPVVKLRTSTSSPFLEKNALRSAMIETPDMGDWF